MKWILPVTSAVVAFLAQGDVTAQVSSNPPCRARTLDLRASSYDQSWASGCQDWVTLLATDTKKKGANPQSINSITDTCGYFFNEGLALAQFHYWQESYDTLMLGIERCPNYPNSSEAFANMGGDVSNFLDGTFSHDSAIYAQFRTWLYSVLYFNNTDPGYFCQAVNEIFNCFSYVKNNTVDSIGFAGANTTVAFNLWLLQNTKCDSSQEEANWRQERRNQIQQWKQDSINGVHYPFDTTIPTLSQIGYGIDTLLAKHALAVVPEQPINIILSATASPNPVTTGTIITFGINQEAYVKINLFNVLGEAVTSPGYEGLFQPGNHEVPLSLQGLPSGTYYARILTAFGSVATVKLVKE